MKGETVYTAIGSATLASSKRSLTVPPATLRNAELQKPVRNRNIKYTAVQLVMSVIRSRDNNTCLQMWGANATGNVNAKKRKYETRYIILRPCTSDKGPTSSGPRPVNRLRRPVE